MPPWQKTSAGRVPSLRLTSWTAGSVSAPFPALTPHPASHLPPLSPLSSAVASLLSLWNSAVTNKTIAGGRENRAGPYLCVSLSVLCLILAPPSFPGLCHLPTLFL